jgi:aryl-alcohol dehydrogenase-like predicted oxidoreductase
VQVGSQPFGWGPVDEAEARSAIRKALDLGINFFDTADVYGLGRSEELLGEELKGRDAILATKAGKIRTEDGENRRDFSKQHITQAAEASLKRLQRDTIDVFQLHNPSEEDIRNGECMEALEELRRAGKIRATGVSIHSPEEGLALLTGPIPPDTLQLVYNLINTRMAKDVLPLALEEDVGVVSRVPFQYGVLTGKFEKDATFHEDDHRTWSLKPETIERGNQLLESLSSQMKQHGLTAAQFALKFVLAHPSISVTIPGARKPEQVQENASVADGRQLPPDLIRSIRDMQVSS